MRLGLMRPGAAGQAALQEKNLSHQPRVLCAKAHHPASQTPSRVARCCPTAVSRRVASCPAAASAAHARPGRRGRRPASAAAGFLLTRLAYGWLEEWETGRPAAASDAPTFGGGDGTLAGASERRPHRIFLVKENRWTPTRA